MVLNYIWVAFFLIAFVIGLIKLIFLGDVGVFPAMVSSTFDMAKVGFDISLGLTGVLTLWLGIMRIGEKGGIIKIFSKFFQKNLSRFRQRPSCLRFNYDEHCCKYAWFG